MGAIDHYLMLGTTNAAHDFYDGLAALLRVCDVVSRQPLAPLASWLPRAQGYINVALKHLPAIGGADYVQRSLAAQWRAANLLACAAPICARWLQEQLAVECRILVRHPEFHFLRGVLPEDAEIVLCLARRVAKAGSLWA